MLITENSLLHIFFSVFLVKSLSLKYWKFKIFKILMHHSHQFQQQSQIISPQVPKHFWNLWGRYIHSFSGVKHFTPKRKPGSDNFTIHDRMLTGKFAHYYFFFKINVINNNWPLPTVMISMVQPASSEYQLSPGPGLSCTYYSLLIVKFVKSILDSWSLSHVNPAWIKLSIICWIYKLA